MKKKGESTCWYCEKRCPWCNTRMATNGDLFWCTNDKCGYEERSKFDYEKALSGSRPDPDDDGLPWA